MTPPSPDRPSSPFHPYVGRFDVHPVMPEHGVARDRLLDELGQMAHEEDAKADAGRVSGSIYSGDHEHYAFLAEAFEHFAHANVLQRDMYPSATKMESEIIAMTAELMHGDATIADPDHPDKVGGLVTSGGTESLVTAMLTYREWGRRTKGIERAHVVMPVTGHPAMRKAFHWFDMDVTLVPVGPDQRADVAAMEAAITPSTVALVGSAGTYPHGVVDPITELGRLALDRGLGLHVDGCLGGFILCWADDLGHASPPWDFRVPGVTSISADTHKYGFGFKGSSVLLFRPVSLRREQYAIVHDWPGGAYSSPGMSGSRSGGLIAATWAAMLSLGKAGYRSIAADIFGTAAAVKEAVRSHPELMLLGDSLFNVAVAANPAAEQPLDIFHVVDGLAARGWRMNGLQLPPAFHFCITRPNTQPGVAEAFATDLAATVAHATQPDLGAPRSGAMYGSGGRVVDPQRVAAGMAAFLDAVHEVGPVGPGR